MQNQGGRPVFRCEGLAVGLARRMVMRDGAKPRNNSLLPYRTRHRLSPPGARRASPRVARTERTH